VKLLVVAMMVGLLVFAYGCEEVKKFLPETNVTEINNSEPQYDNLTVDIPPPPPSEVTSSLVPHPGNLSVYVLQVSSGEAVLAISPEGETLLINSGPEQDALSVVREIRNLGYNQLDYVVATTPDPQYIGGLPSIFRRLSPGTIIYSGLPAPDAFLNYAAPRWINLPTDEIFDFGSASIRVMVPYDDVGYSPRESTNTLPVAITFGSQSFVVLSKCDDDCQILVDDDLSSNFYQVLFLANEGSCQDNTRYLLSSSDRWVVQPVRTPACAAVEQTLQELGLKYKSVLEGKIEFTTDGVSTSMHYVPT